MASINRKSSKRITAQKKPVASAIRKGRTKKELLSEFYEAVDQGKLETVERCILDDVDVNRKDPWGFTALQQTVMQEHLGPKKKIGLMDLLMEAGSDIHAKCKDGRTVLYLAAEFCRHSQPVEKLLDAGADADVSNQGVHVTDNANTPKIRKLLQAAAGIEAKPNKRRKALKGNTLTKSQWAKARRKISAVFKVLETQRLVTMHSAGYTQSDGFADCTQLIHELGGPRKSGLKGFCFYTRQDLERVKATGELMLAFWAAPTGGKRDMKKVGKLIVAEFEAAGFEVAWDGKSDSRPKINVGATCN